LPWGAGFRHPGDPWICFNGLDLMTGGKMGANTAEKTIKKRKLTREIRKYTPFYCMFLPIALLFIIICYIPMAGIFLAFTEYTPFKGPNFIGFENFQWLFKTPAFLKAVRNTLLLSLINLFLGVFLAVTVSVLLNEIKYKYFKRFVQTVIYLPHFMSWVVVASIFTILLSFQSGSINALLNSLGLESVFFLGTSKWWTPVFLFIARWKDTGWMTIIFFAAISGINPDLYEAARIDGAGRARQILNITAPLLMPTILTVIILNLAKVLNIFESVFVLQNDLVLDNAEVISTYVYKVGLKRSDYGYATAVGFFKSLIALCLVLITNRASTRIKGESLL
jgi:putative aldouronate transport system permease protein